jgi:long-subunit fatty acid transport protein
MRALVSLLTLFSAPAFAGSIQAPGVIAGPDSGATTANPAAVYYNPAALAPADGFQFIFDVQTAFVRVDAESLRNGGIDPNTDEAYNLATARVKVPVTFIGGSYEIIENKLTAGLGLTMPFVGGGDYTSSEKEATPPYKSHQRYFGVDTKVITGQVIPAIGYTPVEDWGLHIGAGFTYTIDMFSIVKTSRTAGAEDFNTDAILSGKTTGSHMGWNAGLMFDKFEQAQVGLSYTSGGEFNGTGEGEIEFPKLFTGDLGESKALPANLEVALNLPEILRASFNSQVNEKFNIGVGWDHYRWNKCCGDEEGDIHVTITDDDGNEVGSADDDGVSLAVSSEIHSPRRLWDASNYTLFSGYQVNKEVWLGGRLAYNQNAVPDYAVSATNLDFENVGFQVGSKYRIPMGSNDGGMTIGLSYSKFFLVERNVTDTAWDNGSTDTRFSPKEAPLNVSGDGNYSGKVDIVGLRLGWDR